MDSLVAARSAALRNGAGRKLPPALADGLIFAAAILPLLIVRYPPLVDLPNHLARLAVISDLPRSPVLQRFYFIRWDLMPNLGVEILGFLCRNFADAGQVVWLCCVVTLGLLFAGTRSINLFLGGPGARAYRFTPIFFYSGPFQYGFLSFMLATGLAVLAFAMYLRARLQFRVWTYPAFAAFGILVMLCHLVPFGVLGLAVGAFEIAETDIRGLRLPGSPARRQALAASVRVGAMFLPALLLFHFASPTSTLPLGHGATLRDHAEALAALTMFARPWQEIAILAGTIAVAGLALASGAVRIDRRVHWMIAAFAILFMAVPRVGFGSGLIEYRIPTAACFFLIGFVVPGAAPGRYRTLFKSAGAGLIIWRTALIAWLWISWQPAFSDIIQALRHLPEGSRVMVVEGDPGSTTARRNPPLDHIAAYAVTLRHAFEPQMFGNMSGIVLHFQDSYTDLWTLGAPSRLDSLDRRYDHLLVINPSLTTISPGLNLKLDAAGRYFELFSIRQRNG